MNSSGDELQQKLREAARHHTVLDGGSQRVARVYAEALLRSAEKRQLDEEVLGELQGLVTEVYSREPGFSAFLASPAIARDRKSGLLEATFRGRVSEPFFNFLQVLNQHDRLGLLQEIALEFTRLYNERRHRVQVEVRTTQPLADEQRGQIAAMVRERLKLEPILEERIDPSLIGGLVVRVGNWVYDASVRNKLEQVKSQLIARGSHEIQVGRNRFSH